MASKYNVEYTAGGNTPDLNMQTKEGKKKRKKSGSAQFLMTIYMNFFFFGGLLAGSTQNIIRVAQVCTFSYR